MPDLVRALGLVADGMAALERELRRANKIQIRSLFVAQLDRAIDDPSLAQALSTLEGLSEGKRRQMIFANKQYSLLLLAYETGGLDRADLLGALKVLSKNPVFAEYWTRTSEQRGKLPPDSFEARTGRAVDVIMDERLDDLEDWWVVGPEAGATS
ncbi:DUF6082 family protein [Streptomyces pseudovenezuelae]|uniref:DUF6082 family protein n=1 Tax=Streptomyces pseudovenezuelae TaxID=67350 RepID=UPI0036E163C0